MKQLVLGALLLAIPAAWMATATGKPAEPAPMGSEYKLLDPITHGDLTVFPVVSTKTYDTNGFLTLDEGIRSGEVVVTEVGNLHSQMRRRPIPQAGGAEVNRLVLINNSSRPLILLAGEIVTGGK